MLYEVITGIVPVMNDFHDITQNPVNISVSLEDLNPAQYEAVTTTEGPVLVIAGAGSGKTRTLVHRVAYLISKGVDPASIVITSYSIHYTKLSSYNFV